MGRFLNGTLVGLGIGLLLAPETGQETRNLLVERWHNLQQTFDSGQKQRSQFAQSTGNTASQLADSLNDTVQKGVNQTKSVGDTVAATSQQATSKMKQSSENMANMSQRAKEDTL